MSTVTITQVAVKYWQNVGSLLSDISADNRTTTLGRLSADILVECLPTYRPMLDRCSTDMSAHISSNTSRLTYRATLYWYVDRHIRQHSADMLTDLLVDCRSICRPICRSRVEQNTHDPSCTCVVTVVQNINLTLSLARGLPLTSKIV